MQLSKKKKIATTVGRAALGLLSGAAITQTQDSFASDADTGLDATADTIEVDMATLFYSEKDRVSALEPVVSVRKESPDGSALNVKLVYDSLSGASPNGAPVDNTKAQTFTSASGNSGYQAAAGELPLDDSFRDSRIAVSVGLEKYLNRLTKISYGGNVSSEYDYRSLSLNAALARDSDDRNRTYSGGLSFGKDTISPEGGLPKPLANTLPGAGESSKEGSSDTKDVFDVLVGVSQIVDANTIMQLNYSLSQSSGYLNDPFKFVLVDAGASPVYIFEKRPDTRNKQSIYWLTKHHRFGDTMAFSYRHLWDDWGISSDTFDVKYRWNFQAKQYVEPHLRFYSQGSADFYTGFLTVLPSSGDVSADYRLAEFDAITYGLKWGMALKNKSKVSLRLEQYQQRGKGSSAELFPELDATMVTVGYSFKWK